MLHAAQVPQTFAARRHRTCRQSVQHRKWHVFIRALLKGQTPWNVRVPFLAGTTTTSPASCSRRSRTSGSENTSFGVQFRKMLPFDGLKITSPWSHCGVLRILARVKLALTQFMKPSAYLAWTRVCSASSSAVRAMSVRCRSFGFCGQCATRTSPTCCSRLLPKAGYNACDVKTDGQTVPSSAMV